jgi:hypothetical protein
MRLKIQRHVNGYTAEVTPSHGDDVAWTVTTPISQSALIDVLNELGFHQQDIGDAFYEADPDWLNRPLHEGEDAPPRE